LAGAGVKDGGAGVRKDLLARALGEV